MELELKLEAFEGPLDLLLHLLEKNKVDIYDIPIVEITKQYLEYVSAMQKERLEVTSEFLLMASTLLAIKTRMLLPKPPREEEMEEDPREELIQQLLAYKLYRSMADQLKGQEKDAGRVIFGGSRIPAEVKAYEIPVDPEEMIAESKLDLPQLYQIFLQLQKQEENRRDPVRAPFGKIKREEISLEDRMGQMREELRQKKRTSFFYLIAGVKSKTELVVTFLALLELMKAGEIQVKQESSFGEISIVCKEEDGWKQEN